MHSPAKSSPTAPTALDAAFETADPAFESAYPVYFANSFPDSTAA